MGDPGMAVRLAVALAAALVPAAVWAADEAPKVRLNTIGYLPDRPKKVSIAGPCTQFQDIQDDYRTNEIAINWNGALIYALAGFVDGGAERESRAAGPAAP